MPRHFSRPLGRGSAHGGAEDLAAPGHFSPGGDGTIDPRLLSSPGFPVAAAAYSSYAPLPFSSDTHYQYNHSTNFDSEGDIEEYTTTSPNFANYTSVPSETSFDALIGQNQDFYPDNSVYDASGIDISHNTPLESVTTHHLES